MKYERLEPQPAIPEWGVASGFAGLVVALSLGFALTYPTGWPYAGPLHVGVATTIAVIAAVGWVVLRALGLKRQEPSQRGRFGLASALGFSVGLGLGLAFWVAPFLF